MQDEQQDAQMWAALTDEDRNSRMSQLRSAERQAPSSVAFANDAVTFLNFVSSEPRVIHIFVEPYLVDRLAAMMNKNLAELTGKR